MLTLLLIINWIILISGQSTPPNNDWPIVSEEVPAAYWQDLAKTRLKETCQKFPNLPEKTAAKNVILFLGDGMGLPTIAASRFYISTKEGLTGTATQHPFESWPFASMAKTYDLETMVTDSASSATAYCTGTKTRTGLIGVTGNVKYKQCGKLPEAEFTESVLKAAKAMKKATGIVTTTTVTHASPSGNYGHVSFRNFESDADYNVICNSPETGTDLAYQLIQLADVVNVVMGGGQENFMPNNKELPCDPTLKGKRMDGKNLVEDWMAHHKSAGHKYRFVGEPIDMQDLDPELVDYVLALPYASHMPYNHDLPPYQPGLHEYTRKAVEILRRDPNGFYLFVEGGRIDLAHHTNNAKYAMDEMLEFDRTIEVVSQLVNLNETLMIVTADHSHSFELVGQPSRFHDPSGLEHYYSLKLADKKPMTGWNYMNGPNGLLDAARPDPLVVDTTLYQYQQQAMVPISFSTHGGDDVGVYAIGPFSSLFHRTMDNTFIAHALKFAMGGAPYSTTSSTPCNLFKGSK